MLWNIVLACAVMVGTTLLHAIGMIITFRFTTNPLRHIAFAKAFRVSVIIMLMFIITVFEALLWAVVFWGKGAIQTIEQAMYFSMVTYTTLGYGDIVLDQQWRLLSSFEAANGIIMFGWTTSIVIAYVQRLYHLPTESTLRKGTDED